MLPDGQKDGNVPIGVLLAKPEIWPLQVLDSLAQLDQVVLRCDQSRTQRIVVRQPRKILGREVLLELVEVLEKVKAVLLGPNQGLRQVARRSFLRWKPGILHDSHEMLAKVLASSIGTGTGAIRDDLGKHAVDVSCSNIGGCFL